MSQKPELCIICDRRPAAITLANFFLCALCYNAVSSPDPTCFECGEALSEVDVELGEVFCEKCREESPASEAVEEDV